MADDVSLARVIEDALQERARLLADGTLTKAQIAESFEAVVRQVWPFTRAWVYACEHCRDTGLEMFVCRPGARCAGVSTRTDSPFDKPGKYARLCKQHPDSDETHEYGLPCVACNRGDRFRPRERTMSDDLSDAASSKPKRAPSRFGGR